MATEQDLPQPCLVFVRGAHLGPISSPGPVRRVQVGISQDDDGSCACCLNACRGVLYALLVELVKLTSLDCSAELNKQLSAPCVGIKPPHPSILYHCVASAFACEGLLAVSSDADSLAKQLPRVTAQLPHVPNAAATAQCGDSSGSSVRGRRVDTAQGRMCTLEEIELQMQQTQMTLRVRVGPQVTETSTI